VHGGSERRTASLRYPGPVNDEPTSVEGFRVSVLTHFIACENGWRGTAYVYRGAEPTACEVLFVPDLCLQPEEARAMAMQRGVARAGELSRLR